MKACVKVTVWKEVELPEDLSEKEAIDILKRDNSVNGFFDDEFYERYKYILEYNDIPETEEDMTIEENNDQATLELRNDDGDVIWDNLNGKLS